MGWGIATNSKTDASPAILEEPGDQLQLQLDRLTDEAAKYANTKLDVDVGEQWNW